jgi:hypothetical protein
MSDDITFSRQWDPRDGDVLEQLKRVAQNDDRPSLYGWKPSRALWDDAHLAGIEVFVNDLLPRDTMLVIGGDGTVHKVVLGAMPLRGVPHEVSGIGHRTDSLSVTATWRIFTRGYLPAHGGGYSEWLDADTGQQCRFATGKDFRAVALREV